MILRARCVLPMNGPPIDNGAVALASGRVQWVGRWRDLEAGREGPVRDLGEVALLPGLINGHCHLDYTGMAGQLPPPKHFPDWIKMILSLKAHWSYTDYAASWLKGAHALLESGTTTVCDIEAFPELVPDVWASTPLRVISLLEVTGLREAARAEELLTAALEKLEELPREGRSTAGLSPHALYSTFPAVMRRGAAEAQRRGVLLSTHLAESEAEFEMFRSAAGPMFEWLRSQRPTEDCGERSPIRLAHDYGVLGANCLVAHANYLGPGDAELLALTGTTVVHCPRSHEYFGHAAFPFEALRAAGVNVCLGTDSLASTLKKGAALPELSMWPEMRRFAEVRPGVAPREIFEMATRHAAKGIGRAGKVGEIKEDAEGDFVTLGYTGPVKEGPVFESLLFEGTVRDVMVAGEFRHGALTEEPVTAPRA